MNFGKFGGDATSKAVPHGELRFIGCSKGRKSLARGSRRSAESERCETMSNLEGQLVTAALDTLHGARGLPAAEAAEKLRDFLASIGSPILNNARLSDASSALKTLVSKLEKGEPATNDDWGHAIQTMTSLASETS
jgi:hypothetical protein